jgi:uncharacterized protein YbaR (Trm112 family)
LKERLLEWLRCPGCGGALACRVDAESPGFAWREIEEGLPTCAARATSHPIRAGVPRLVPAEAGLADVVISSRNDMSWRAQGTRVAG